MALMSGGSTPNRGPYGQQVSRAIEYLLSNAQPSGFIAEPSSTTHGPMYGHGFATTFLANATACRRGPKRGAKAELRIGRLRDG